MRRLAFSLGALSALFLALALISGGRAQAQAAVTLAVDLDPAATAGIRIEGLASDSQGRLYTSDLDSRRLWRYTPSTIICSPSVHPGISSSSPNVVGSPRLIELSNVFPSVVHPV